jgi:hypothetical protein
LPFNESPDPASPAETSPPPARPVLAPRARRTPHRVRAHVVLGVTAGRHEQPGLAARAPHRPPGVDALLRIGAGCRSACATTPSTAAGARQRHQRQRQQIVVAGTRQQRRQRVGGSPIRARAEDADGAPLLLARAVPTMHRVRQAPAEVARFTTTKRLG